MSPDRLTTPAAPTAYAAAPDHAAHAERSGAQIICESLIRHGVDVLFGIPGGAIMPFYHALW